MGYIARTAIVPPGAHRCLHIHIVKGTYQVRHVVVKCCHHFDLIVVRVMLEMRANHHRDYRALFFFVVFLITVMIAVMNLT